MVEFGAPRVPIYRRPAPVFLAGVEAEPPVRRRPAPALPKPTEAQRKQREAMSARIGMLERFEPRVATRSARSGHVVPVIFLTSTDPGDKRSMLAHRRRCEAWSGAAHARNPPPLPRGQEGPGSGTGRTRAQQYTFDDAERRPWAANSVLMRANRKVDTNRYGPTYQWSEKVVDYMWQGQKPHRNSSEQNSMVAAARLSKGSPETRLFASLFIRGTIHAAC